MATDRTVTEVSRYLSYVLRHRPDAIGLTVDREGWADISELIAGAARAGKQLNRQLIERVVVTNDKQRFAISGDGLRIRALQGHSMNDVAISYPETAPPEFLYHGTAKRFLDSISKTGLVPGSRRYVHLGHDRQAALAVGQRHGSPIVVTVAASRMHKRRVKFFQAENGVWLTEAVPAEFISV